LHAVLCEIIEGGLSKNLSAKRASVELRKLQPPDAIGIERKRIATELLDEVRRIDHALVELHGRIGDAVKAAHTAVTDVFGVGPIVACYLIGYSGDVDRFPSAGHYARYNATAPIEASSGPKVRHRLNPNGNRHLNHAIHIAALGQISHDTAGRVYYLAKQAEGKSRKEAMRCLKRRISDAVFRELRADIDR
jgi:transposase